jgi:hypothetical protein
MDIIDILKQEQLSLGLAQRATTSAVRQRHEAEARKVGDALRGAGYPHRPYPQRVTSNDR